jgi:hypothetical protein
MSERHRRPAIGRIAPGLEDDRDGRPLAFNDRRLKYLLAKLRDLQLTLAALGLWSPLVVAGANALVLLAGASSGSGIRGARRCGASGPVVDRLRRVLAVHAIQAGERLLASCSDATATRFQSWG